MHYRYDNVITLRTFSKIYGLAGIRIGYGFAHEELIANLLKVKLPFEPCTPAAGGGHRGAGRQGVSAPLAGVECARVALPDRTNCAEAGLRGGAIGGQFRDAGAGRTRKSAPRCTRVCCAQGSSCGRWRRSGCRAACAFRPARTKRKRTCIERSESHQEGVCSDIESEAGGAVDAGFPAAERNRLRRVLCRQCATGRVLLPRGLRHEAGGLSRTGNGPARPRLLRAGAGQDPLRAHHPASPGRPHRRTHPAARRRRARHRAVGGRRRSRLARNHQAWRAQRA